MTANRFVVLSSDDEEEWVPPTVAASRGAVRRVHQGRSQAVDDVRVVSQVEEMSTAEVFPMTDDAVDVPRMPQRRFRGRRLVLVPQSQDGTPHSIQTGCLMSLRADIPDLPAEQAMV